ncbi:helix-turn-helix domain-containing protein [Paenibacillus sp. GXUN7292]|uniref:helix-turn-helix domain-containing protein n=1 Tax=Paenibacillus sp. GXUN7292 TaxID=3422499 RepID=UPI003D7CCEE4
MKRRLLSTEKMKFLYKLIIGLLLMAVLPTSLTVYVLHDHYTESMLQEVGSANKQLLEQAKTNGDMMFSEMVYVAANLLNQPKLSVFMQEEYSSDAKSFNDLILKLDNLQAESRFLSGIYLHFDKFDYMIGADKETGTFFRTRDEMSAVEKELTALSGAMHQPRFFLQKLDGRQVFVMVRPVQNAAYRNVGSILLIVEENRFADIFNPLRLSDLDTTIVLDANGSPLWCNGSACTEGIEKSLYSTGATQVNNSDYQVMEWGETKFAVSYTSSEISRWQLISMLPMERLTSRLSVANQLTLLVLLTTIVVAIACSIVYGRYLYSPLQKLVTRVLPHGSGKQLRHNEFQLIRDAYMHVLNSKTDLERFVENNRLLMISKLLQRVMTGYEMDRAAIIEQLAFLNIQLPHRFFTVVLVGGLASRMHEEESIRTRTIAQLAWLNRAERIMAELELDGVAIELEIDVIAVLLNAPTDDCDKILEFARLFTFPDPELADVSPLIGVGETVEELEKIYHSYHKARYELACQSAAPDSDFAQNTINPLSLFEKKMGHAIAVRDPSISVDTLNELFDWFGDFRDLSWSQVMNIVLKLLSAVLIRLEGTNFAVYQEFMRRPLFHQLATLKSESELRDWLERVLGEIIERLNEVAGISSIHPKIRQAIVILGVEYMNDLTLESVADRIGLNAAYMSKLFKDETNFNFIDYMNRIRIENSKLRLIEQPSLSLDDIAQSVGYNNTQSFARFFKKYEGCTPGQFRQQSISS